MFRQALLILIRIYQLALSPLLGPCCRFEPSCSRYTAQCVERFGVLRGSWLGLRRLLRCHPWNAGGHDPPPLPPGHEARDSSPSACGHAAGDARLSSVISGPVAPS
jgi:putative membrane protein insertion efficiency factor